ncbi:hypothetical protein Ancab_004669 [Ancistrocladus abbreviatus]
MHRTSISSTRSPAFGAPSFPWMGTQAIREGVDFSSSKINSRTDKTESVMLVKRATMDSMSRVPCSPEEIYNASSEKEVHRSGDKHALSKDSGPKLAKISRVSSRQDKIELKETECDQRGQRVSREKAECREKVGGYRCTGAQTFQTKDGSSGEMPLHFLFQRQKKLKK